MIVSTTILSTRRYKNQNPREPGTRQLQEGRVRGRGAGLDHSLYDMLFMLSCAMCIVCVV